MCVGIQIREKNMTEVQQAKQEKQASKLDLRQDIFATDLTDLQNKLVYIVNETRAIQYDECTGNYLVRYGHVESICSETEAKGHFRTIFMSHCYIKKTMSSNDGMKTVVERVTRDMLNDIFLVAGRVITFNSRLDFYNAIPKWDGIPRVDTFMKDLFECDASPNFFRLFLTSVLGKIKDPKNSYVPFFFDFIGNKGVGKSYLCPLLFGEDMVQILQPCSRAEDIYTQVYQFGSVIAIDDELKISGPKAQRKMHAWTADDLKAFVTCTRDTFSRKGMQLETHPRAFVFVRTSNEAKTTTEPDERRQIIFESKLPALECRLFNYGPEYYEQVLAEAKDYYEKHGMYKLTPEDWAEISIQQCMYANTETPEYIVVEEFIRVCKNRIELQNGTNKLFCWCGKYIATWNDFYEWQVNEKNVKPDNVIKGNSFWLKIQSVSQTTRMCSVKQNAYMMGNKNKTVFCYINALTEA